MNAFVWFVLILVHRILVIPQNLLHTELQYGIESGQQTSDSHDSALPETTRQKPHFRVTTSFCLLASRQLNAYRTAVQQRGMQCNSIVLEGNSIRFKSLRQYTQLEATAVDRVVDRSIIGCAIKKSESFPRFAFIDPPRFVRNLL